MRQIVGLIVAVGAFGWANVASSASVPTLFAKERNAVGYADKTGALNIWWDFDRKVSAADEVEFPVRLQFNSRQHRFGDSCLGMGWWVPLLESNVTKISESEIDMNLPGGRSVKLYLNPNTSGQYDSKDLRFSGAMKDGARFVVATEEGWELHFSSGRLTWLRTAGGDVWDWDFQDNKATTITSKKKGVLVKARYDRSGMLEGLSYGGKEQLKFSYGKYPVAVNLLGQSLVKQFLPTLTSVKSESGYAGLMEVDVKGGGDYEMVVKESENGRSPQTKSFSWNTQDQSIVAADVFRYVVEGANPSGGYASLITRTDPKGRAEKYQYDAKKLVLSYQNFSGTEWTYQYIGSPGKAFGAVRKIEKRLPAEDSFKQVWLSHFDAEGRMIRCVDSVGKTWIVKNVANNISAEEALKKIEEVGGNDFVRLINADGDKVAERDDQGSWIYKIESNGSYIRGRPEEFVEQLKNTVEGARK